MRGVHSEGCHVCGMHDATDTTVTLVEIHGVHMYRLSPLWDACMYKLSRLTFLWKRVAFAPVLPISRG